MVFSSLVFLYLFLPVSLIIYYLIGSRIRSPSETGATSTRGHATKAQNLILIAASFFFYGWGEPVWVALLVLSSWVGWLVGIWVEQAKTTTGKKIAVFFAVLSNLCLLATFKYSDFIVENINYAFVTGLNNPGFALPIGISFYTFQILSYVVDVYRGEVRAQRRFLDFLLYVSLFHQLVAGPIVRYVHIANEINNRIHTWSDFSQGLHRVCVGLFKKVFIANVAGEWAQRTLGSDLSTLSTADAWLGLAMFTIQIYFDFSAYSDMAIGLGMMFGFHYRENFNYPYIAKSVTDFWRRWHISLGTFFRDYVYIPLGGNKSWALRNLFIVWALTGFWHGASWNFMLWGLYFGVWIALERLFIERLLNALPIAISHLYLMMIVTLGWALFYFTDLSRLMAFFQILFGTSQTPTIGISTLDDLASHAVWILIAILWCMPVGDWLQKHFRWCRFNQWSASAQTLTLLMTDSFLLLSSTALLVGQSYNPFLYFRF
ncbi:MBOAT family O-acyltransferase [Zwartia sp.]|uniref:MBOAT family O-acyltransferase n=1 Tax=Zwartia sp. TaxID=2978004 RepID=UPI003BAF86D9